MVVSGPCYLNMLWTCAFVIQILLAVLIILRYITAFHANICLVHLWHGSVSFNKIGPQSVRLCRGHVMKLFQTSNMEVIRHAQCVFNFTLVTLPSLLIKKRTSKFYTGT